MGQLTGVRALLAGVKDHHPGHGGIRCRILNGWKWFISLIRISMAFSDLLPLSQFRDGKLGGIFPKCFQLDFLLLWKLRTQSHSVSLTVGSMLNPSALHLHHQKNEEQTLLYVSISPSVIAASSMLVLHSFYTDTPCTTCLVLQTVLFVSLLASLTTGTQQTSIITWTQFHLLFLWQRPGT